jgi:hypothetical protein
MGRAAGFASRRASLVALIGEPPEEPLGHHAAAAVGEANEEHIHLCRLLDRFGFGRARRSRLLAAHELVGEFAQRGADARR